MAGPGHFGTFRLRFGSLCSAMEKGEGSRENPGPRRRAAPSGRAGGGAAHLVPPAPRIGRADGRAGREVSAGRPRLAPPRPAHRPRQRASGWHGSRRRGEGGRGEPGRR